MVKNGNLKAVRQNGEKMKYQEAIEYNEEQEKIKEAEKNDIDEYDNPEIAS